MSTKIWDIYNKLNQDFLEDESDDEKSLKSNEKSNESSLNSNEIDFCYNCNSNDIYIDNSNGVILCRDCGCEISLIIDEKLETRFFGGDDKKSVDNSRCGGPINEHFPKASLHTTISGNVGRKLKLFSKWQSMDYDERKILNSFNIIDKKVDKMQVNECIKDQAKIMFKKFGNDDGRRGTCKESYIAASVLLANQSKGENELTKKDVSKMFSLNEKKMKKGIKQYKEIIYFKDNELYKKLKVSNIEDEIDKNCKLLNIPDNLIQNIKYVASISSTLGINIDNTPTSIAVTSIYFVCYHNNLGLNKKDIEEKCDISEVTITKAYKELMKYKEYLLPK
jgi:transcription initiation factor TFIIIB Brf1 subunit/transcription initiation factor TFIIB